MTLQTVSFVVIALLALALAITCYLFLDERLRRTDAEFRADEACHTLRIVSMRCPKCSGTGSFALIGAWMRCDQCLEARLFLARYQRQ